MWCEDKIILATAAYIIISGNKKYVGTRLNNFNKSLIYLNN
jgi:hypothetical protein